MAMLGRLGPYRGLVGHDALLKREDDSTQESGTALDARDEWGDFLYPSRAQPLQQWRLGENVTIRFATGFGSYTLTLWQESRDGTEWKVGKILLAEPLRPSSVEGVTKESSLGWIVQLYELDIEYSHVFLFRVNNGSSSSQSDLGNNVRGFTSPYFNILEKAADTSSVSAQATSTSTSTSIGASTSTSTSTGTTTGPATVDSEGDGKSNVTAIALGTVLGVVGLAVLLGLFFWLGMRRRKRKEHVHDMTVAADAAAAAAWYHDSSYPSPHDGQVFPVVDVYKQQRGPPQQRPVELGH